MSLLPTPSVAAPSKLRCNCVAQPHHVAPQGQVGLLGRLRTTSYHPLSLRKSRPLDRNLTAEITSVSVCERWEWELLGFLLQTRSPPLPPMEKSGATGGDPPLPPQAPEELALVGKKPIKNPFVPIGALVTAGVLTAGLISFKQGNSELGQKLMRARVLAQGATVAVMVGSAYYYGDQIKLFKRKSSSP